jgi:hypothetical protein
MQAAIDLPIANDKCELQLQMQIGIAKIMPIGIVRRNTNTN